MNGHRNNSDNETEGRLDRAVDAIFAQPCPKDARERLVNAAASWTPATLKGHHRRWSNSLTALAVAASFLLAFSIIHYVVTHADRTPLVPSQDGPQTADSISNLGATVDEDGATPAHIASANVGAAWLSLSPYLAVAADDTILVCAGRDKPIRLGEKQPYATYSTVHVWDWSKSDQSRPLNVSNEDRMAVSPDGKWIVTGDGRIIDTATGRLSSLDHDSAGFRGDVRGLRFSPDGQTLALMIHEAGGLGTARILDFPGTEKRFELRGQMPYTFAHQFCAFTPDSRQLILMDKDRFIRRWDARTGKELARYEPGFESSISACAVSPDARYLAASAHRRNTGTGGDIHLWELAGGKLLHKLLAKQQRDIYSGREVASLAFSSDSKLIAGGGIQNLVLWSTATGQIERIFPSSSGGVVHIRFSKDSSTLTTVRNFYIAVSQAGEDALAYPSIDRWDSKSGKRLSSAGAQQNDLRVPLKGYMDWRGKQNEQPLELLPGKHTIRAGICMPAVEHESGVYVTYDPEKRGDVITSLPIEIEILPAGSI